MASPHQVWIQEKSSKPKLIQEVDQPSGLEQTRKLIEEVSIEDEDPAVAKNKEESKELLHGIGQIINSPGSMKLAKAFEEDEKKYANMTREEKIQDLAENMGSSRGRKYDNMDVWSPDDDLD